MQRTVAFGAVHGIPEGFRNDHPVGPQRPRHKQSFHPVVMPESKEGLERDLFLLVAEGDDTVKKALAAASEEELLERRPTGGLLHAAIAGAYPHAIEAVIDVLPDAGFAVTDEKSGTALHAAAANACYPAVHALVARLPGSALLTTNDDGCNPLQLAVKALVERVDQGNGIWKTLFGATPIEGRVAVMKGGKNVLHTIAASRLGAGFPVNLVTDLPAHALAVQDENGLIPLHCAFSEGDETAVDAIVKHTPASVYSQQYPVERDILSWALCRTAERGMANGSAVKAVVEGTIAAGALEKTSFDRSPLLMALEGEGNHEAFILLAKAAPLELLVARDAYTPSGVTPLLGLLRGYVHEDDNRLAMLQALVERLPKESFTVAEATSGDTVLHLAARLRFQSIPKLLFSFVPEEVFSLVNVFGDTPAAAAIGCTRTPDMPLLFLRHVPSYHISEMRRFASKLCDFLPCDTRLQFLDGSPTEFLRGIPKEVWEEQDVGGPLHAIAQAPCQRTDACTTCDKSIDLLCSILTKDAICVSNPAGQSLAHYAAECCAPRVLQKALPILPDDIIAARYNDDLLGPMTLLEAAARTGNEAVVKVVAAHVPAHMRTTPTTNGISLVELFRAASGGPGSPQVCYALQASVKSAQC